jgi:predicted dehydrogenase
VSATDRQVRLGLVGVGLHGARYAKHIVHDVSETRLVALTRRDRATGEEVAREFGADYAPSVDELVARSDVDAVVVVTPPAAHLTPCLAALEAGKDALVEKPMVATLDEALQLERAVAASSARFMLGQTLRYDTVLCEVRRRLPELGRVVQVRASQRLEPSPLAWQREHSQTGAGSILLTGVHLFDLVRWLFDDEVSEVFCRSRRVLNQQQEDFFAASVMLERTGIHADLEISKYTRSRSCRIEVVGEEAQLFGDYWNNRLFVASGRDQHELEIGPQTYTVEATVRAFARALLAGEDMPITVEDGVRSLEIIEACYASARSGQPVSIAAAG